MKRIKTKVAIIGGGLSGLALAWELSKKGVDWHLLESRPRFGGRISCGSGHSDLLNPDGPANPAKDVYDLGPAWFWPGQPLIASLCDELSLDSYSQYSSGALVFEDRQGAIRRDLNFSTMGNGQRLEGGMSRLIEGLVSQVEPKRLHVKARANQVMRNGESIRIGGFEGDDRLEVIADQVVLSIPPRLAARSIDFGGGVDISAIRKMVDIPTWMAGHAKLVAVYNQPFWRENGLSGDGMSHRGPLMEIHDASPATAEQGALFGFFGIPPVDRRKLGREALIEVSLRQLGRIFGSEASKPKSCFYQDWADEKDTSTTDDLSPLYEHPQYGLPPELKHLWGGKLILASTETAPHSGGLMEGALEAALSAAQSIVIPS